jgi:DNA-binding beta-propeller fold protein YncE
MAVHEILATPPVRAPAFPTNLDWINTGGEALTLEGLRGKIVLLDFWSYGCINCQHVIPQLRELEHRFPAEVAIIGVHAGKYTAERETDRIRPAARRLGVMHPIVNDRQYRIWRSFAVRAWPTLVFIDPTGAVLGSHAGEFTAEMLAPLVERLIATHEPAGEIDRQLLAFPPDADPVPSGTLRYPAKVAVQGDLIAVADTAHHRVLVGSLTGVYGEGREGGGRRMVVTHVAGDGVPGFSDGLEARFNSPAGVAFQGETLYIADIENHAVRALSLVSGGVRTVAGTGHQLRTRRERAAGAMSSPWDVAVAGDVVYVAMAGTHQIWALRGSGAHSGGDVVAGSGGEDITDGPAGDALLAQPMGLTPSPDGRRIYFLDAESSSVRSLAVEEPGTGRPSGEVRTIVGTGLFDFGDRDGEGDTVRLQHAQGIAIHPSGRLLVADSYNDAVKWVDPVARTSTTFLKGFREPGGLAYHAGRELLYVADTNAHRIAVVDERTGDVSSLEIAGAPNA